MLSVQQRHRKNITISLICSFLLLFTVLITFSSKYEDYEGKKHEKIQFWENKQTEWEIELINLHKQNEQYNLLLSNHFLDHKHLHILPYSELNSHAIITIIQDDPNSRSPDWIHALILFESLKETKTRVKNKIAVTWKPIETFPEIAIKAFEKYNVQLKYIPIEPQYKNILAETSKKTIKKS